jgi:hypothetical protein
LNQFPLKKLLSFPIALLLWLHAAAQAPLPSSYNFDDPLPVGWTEFLDVVVGNTRYTNGLQGAAFATLIAYFSATFFILFFPETRKQGINMLKSLFLISLFQKIAKR